MTFLRDASGARSSLAVDFGVEWVYSFLCKVVHRVRKYDDFWCDSLHPKVDTGALCSRDGYSQS